MLLNHVEPKTIQLRNIAKLLAPVTGLGVVIRHETPLPITLAELRTKPCKGVKLVHLAPKEWSSPRWVSSPQQRSHHDSQRFELALAVANLDVI